jgi:hypothetical protein
MVSKMALCYRVTLLCSSILQAMMVPPARMSCRP